MVVDPGPDDGAHLRRVVSVAEQAGQRIAAIVLTHGHADHSGGARALAGLTGAGVRAVDQAHRLGDEGLPPGAVVAASGCEIEVVTTPGHTADSVSLYLRADGAVLTGDTVLGRGTTVIADDGNLAMTTSVRSAGSARSPMPSRCGRCCQAMARCSATRRLFSTFT